MNIIVKLQIEATHQWVDCNIEEVDYLSNLHRHIFHIVAKKEVSHADRSIEIIEFKHDLEDYFDKYYNKDKRLYELGGKSCEMLATELYNKFDLVYCSVLEDDENGAEVTK